ncbi:MAG: hypothetical protein KGQ60_12575 [Planctomycetes bacterium]|nr:hypothetical protein [Planctomycetota bacterium]
MDASKVKIGREDALKLARAVKKVVVSRGKKVVTLDLSQPVSDDDLATSILGPTGNLKAPTLRVGSTLVVGFGESSYTEVFGT